METPNRNERQSPTDSALALQAVIGHSPTAIVAIDLDGNVTLWNPAAERMFGWTESEVIGCPYPAVPDSDQEAYHKQIKAEHVGQSFTDLEVQRRRKDGSMFPARLSVAPLKDESGKIVGSVSILADITDQKRPEKALRESEERFRTLVEYAPEAITMLDVDTGLYVDANPMAEALHELPRDALIGKIGPADLSPEIQPDGRPSSEAAPAYLGQALAGEFPRFEWMHLTPDGQETLCEVSLARLPDPHRNLVRASIFEITERKAADEALRLSEQRLRAFLDGSPDAVTLKDTDGRYLLCNKEFERLTGHTMDQLRGKTFSDIFSENKRIIATIEDHEREVMESRRTIRVERETTLAGDPLHPHVITKFPVFGLDGNVTGVGTTSQDITERKRAERLFIEQKQLLQAVVDAVPAIISVKDRDLLFLMVNQVQAEELGCTPEEAIGKHRDAIPRRGISSEEGQRYTDVQTDWEHEVLRTGEARLFYEESFTYENGEVERRLVNKIPLHDADGQIYAVLTVAMDITEQKRAEERLRQAQKMEAVGQLTGGVAHDFNNLLAIILGNLELIQGELAGDGDFRSHVEKAIKATERGAHLTQRLLAFSRKQALRPVTVDASKLIQDMQDLLRRSLGETIEIETVAEAGLWATEIDPGQLETALLNLAINARDAMPDGGKLTIEASNARLADEYTASQIDVEPGQYVLVSVSDTGTGMAPEVREQVFEPFFTTKETGKGTGLGLSMVHGFVKQSGGHIAIYSEIGEGTTIKLYLPRYRGKKAAVERRGRSDEPVSGTGEVILVVEDDADLRTMIINMLQSLGYGVLESGTAKSALEILEETADVNLLLTDVVLPGGMSGRTLADRAQKTNPKLPVLFMSGYTEDAIIHHGRLDEGVQLLEKPFRRDDLSRAIRKILDNGPA